MNTAIRLSISGEAIASSLGFAPEKSSHSMGWVNVEMSMWRGQVDKCAYETFDETVIILHIGGAPKVPVTADCWQARGMSRPGLLTIVPPFSSIVWQVDGGVHSYSLHLPARSLNQTLGAFSGRRSDGRALFRCGARDPLLVNLMGGLAAELVEPTEIGSHYAQSLADSIALHLARDVLVKEEVIPAGGLSEKRLQRALEEMETHLEEGISLQRLANDIGLSRAYFTKAFRRSMGMAPHAYITQRRITLAKSMLADSTTPISEIALSCGFASQAHFTEKFHRMAGQTPANFRKRKA